MNIACWVKSSPLTKHCSKQKIVLKWSVRIRGQLLFHYCYTTFLIWQFLRKIQVNSLLMLFIILFLPYHHYWSSLFCFCSFHIFWGLQGSKLFVSLAAVFARFHNKKPRIMSLTHPATKGSVLWRASGLSLKCRLRLLPSIVPKDVQASGRHHGSAGLLVVICLQYVPYPSMRLRAWRTTWRFWPIPGDWWTS